MTSPEQIEEYRIRVNRTLDSYLPDPRTPPKNLHEAMRYSVLGTGKRIRPVLVYTTGQALGVPLEILDAPAAATELLHAFSLVHDDLPAMDDDELRRGRPTTHRKFDEATAILAADALQPLAFKLLANHPPILDLPQIQVRLVGILAEACASNGMTGGQAIDLASEGRELDAAELEHMYRLKTGRLLRASVISAAYCVEKPDQHTLNTLEQFVDALGLAFQIRDDILDIEGSTEQIGKQQGADIARRKATYPAMFGLDRARERADELLAIALSALDRLNCDTAGLIWLARYIIARET